MRVSEEVPKQKARNYPAIRFSADLVITVNNEK